MRKRHLRAEIRRTVRRIMAAAGAAFVWAGCATIPPAKSGEAAGFASVGAVEPEWEPFAEGVAYAAGRVLEPRLEFWAVRAALGSPRLRVAVNAPGESPGSVASVHTASFARSHGCAAAINATPFRPASAKEGVPLTVVGSAVSEGVEVAAPHPPYDALVFYADGSAAVVAQDALGEAGKPVRNAAGGFFRVLEDGAPLRSPRAARHPRSAAGLSRDGKTLYLLAVDGRRRESVGATEDELGLLMRRLGAQDALGFDGGGSTALALRYPDGSVRAANAPVHGFRPGGERAVAICLGIAAAP
jgi:hypothetical protein